MSRGLDREEEKQESSGVLEGLSRSGSEQRPRVLPQAEESKSFEDNRREKLVVRDREFKVRASEIQTLQAIGRFRLVDASDLVPSVYGTDAKLALADLRSLQEQRLVHSVRIKDAKGDPKRILALSRDGQAIASSRSIGPQRYYSGFIRPAEAEHDSLLYRAYLHEERRITDDGGKVKRVILDHELKAIHFSRVNRPGAKGTYRERQAASAQELRLPVIDGHVVFPDFRIEKENERGERSGVDVEVATGNYREKHITTKVAAGFHVYGAQGGRTGGLSADTGSHLRGHVFRQERGIVFPL